MLPAHCTPRDIIKRRTPLLPPLCVTLPFLLLWHRKKKRALLDISWHGPFFPQCGNRRRTIAMCQGLCVIPPLSLDVVFGLAPWPHSKCNSRRKPHKKKCIAHSLDHSYSCSQWKKYTSYRVAMSTRLPTVISNGTVFKKIPIQLLLNGGSTAPAGAFPDSNPARPRTGITRTCGQCGEIKTSLQWREGPNGAACLCNACGLFFRKLTLRFGRAAAKRYMEQIKGTAAKRRIPKELTGTARF